MTLPLQGYWALMAQYLKPLKIKVLLLACLILGTIGLQLINPQIIRYFIDAAVATGTVDTGVGNESGSSLLFAALLFLGGALLLQGLSVVTVYVGEDIGWRATNKLREDLTRHCLTLDMSFHNEHKPGEMIERIDGDVANIAIFFSQFVVRILGNGLLLIGVLVVLLWTDWRISLVLLLYSGLVVFAFTSTRNKAVPRWKAAREASADIFGFLEEHLAGTEDVRANGAVPYVLRNLFRHSKARLDREIASGRMDILIGNIWNTCHVTGQILAFGLGYWFYQQGTLTVGGVYLVIHYIIMVLEPLSEITNQIRNFQQASASIERVEELTSLSSKLTSDLAPAQSTLEKSPHLLDAGPLGVRFDNVSFSYNDGEPVLKVVSFDLQAGQIFGLLGCTGSGKTTLTRLLFRLYDPNHGAISIGARAAPYSSDSHEGSHYVYTEDGIATSIHTTDSRNTVSRNTDLRNIDVGILRSRVGMVTQDVQLLRGTVRDNITLFNPGTADQQILDIIEQLGVAAWFDRLPAGLDTTLESAGGGLSAGEGQLLAFTRVFLDNPGLVILDEASSRLDPVTEALIERAVERLLQNRTAIIVAHRLETVQRADQIMILHDGTIHEYGSRHHLANDPTSRFYQLLQTGLEEVLS